MVTITKIWRLIHVQCNGKPSCLICQASIAHFKALNLQCHFSSLHANIYQEFPKGTELRKHKLIPLKSQAEKQTKLFQKCTKHSETITLHFINWLGTLQDVEILSPENDKLKRMVSDVRLSRHTAEHRISDINTAIESQLHSDLQACKYFCIALDWMESCEIQDTPLLAIFVDLC